MVQLHVRIEVRTLGETLAAEGAREGFLARVFPDMSLQVRRVIADITAHFAL